ncbi:hypothetical protein Ae201684P_009079 [Aphanomyces euteiches]|uniref:DDE Tnp4 domain-containing protein n=1 Tax=Aphanomyces euteiches TaxID=100861 RepID=A0A6G0WEA3_9STRA|nr:hypothetical protein Ae201684_015901 [Aphanomyces euteiches]KAH9080133.1 hypothetical protein Ae201684P_009079 [Aphanomyces euteiches]
MDIFARLAEETSQERDNLCRASLVVSASVQESEEADDNSHHGHYDTPTIDNIAAQGPQAMMTMTNFSMSEFNSLWGLCEADVNASWYEGRGRRNQTSAKDAFFMLLTVLKHYNTWDKYAADFNLRVPTFERMMHRMIKITEPVLVSLLIPPVFMSAQRRRSFLFDNFPQALYATDVKFQPANRPHLSYLDAKHYYSYKHKLYGFKLEGSVAQAGRYVNVCDHSPGSVSDLTIFLKRIDILHGVIEEIRVLRRRFQIMAKALRIFLTRGWYCKTRDTKVLTKPPEV